MIAAIHTTDCTKLSVEILSTRVVRTYLNRQVEEIQIPVGTRDTVLVDNCHGYRSQTVCQD